MAEKESNDSLCTINQGVLGFMDDFHNKSRPVSFVKHGPERFFVGQYQYGGTCAVPVAIVLLAVDRGVFAQHKNS